MDDREELIALRRLAELEARAAPAAQPQSADANLGGTLQLGVPFTGARLDTGIKLSPDVEAGLVGMGKTGARWLQGAQALIPGQGDAVGKQVAEEDRLVKPLEQAHPLSSLAGQVAPYFATGNMAGLAGLSALEYGTPVERAERAGLSLGGSLAAKGVARLFGPQSMASAASNGAEDFANYAASAGNKWGIPLRAAQTTDSKPVQITDAVLANLPITSGVIAKAKDASYQGFNSAVGKTFGADTTKITQDLLGEKQSEIGRTIGQLAARNTLNPDRQLAQEIVAIGQRASKNLGTDDARIVNNQITELLSKVDPQTGLIPGTNYRAFRSDLGDLAASSNGTLKSVLGDLRNSVTRAMDRSISPEDAKAWAKANREYFNVNQVANAAKATPGELSPTQLLQSVNRSQKNARFGGGNELAELAQFAKPTLGDKIPNSGTAQRAWYQAMLTNPITAVGTLGGAAYGANSLGGVDTADVLGGGLLSYAAARGMAGKPLSEATKKLLQRLGGGLLAQYPLPSE